MDIKRILVGAVLVLGLMVGTANASILTGSFTIDIYWGDGGGTSASPGVQANLSNPLIAPAYFLDEIGYTGEIDFFLPSGGTNTIGAFLGSAGGTITGLDASVAGRLLSAGGFGTTTVLSITGWTGTGIVGTVRHDDGVGFYQGGVLVGGHAAPTPPVDTPISLAPGNFQLIYVAANSLPEQLTIDATGTVPDGGTTLMLLGCALIGLSALRRRR